MASPLRKVWRSRIREEDGSALAVALIFLLVVGILISVALSKSGAVLTSDYRVRNVAQMQYAADAGIDRALQLLRSDLATNSPVKFCQKTTNGKVTMTSGPNAQDPGGLKFNSDITDNASPHGGITVQYTCQTLVGSAPDPTNNQTNNYAVVTTGGKTASSTANTLTTSNGTGKDLVVNGAVFVAGNEQNADLKKKISITGGDFVEFDGGNFGSCIKDVQAVSPSIISVSSAGGYSATCSAQTPVQAVPQVTLPQSAPGVAPAPIDYPLAAGGGKKPATTCRIFLPGKYTSAPSLLDGTDKDGSNANYFVSGLYYFENVAFTVDSGDVVLGGQPNPANGDVTAGPQPNKTGCSDFAGLSDSALSTALSTVFSAAGVTPAGVWSHGTLFVMGGTSTLTLKNGALSLYTPDNLTNQPPTSLVAVRNDKWITSGSTDSSLGYDVWAGGANNVINIQGGGNNVDFVVNGKILAPDAPVSLTGTENTTAVARSGVVGMTVDINATASIQPGSFNFQACCAGTVTGDDPQRRTVQVTATATASDGTTFSEVAVATIDNFGTRPIRVYSWRTN